MSPLDLFFEGIRTLTPLLALYGAVRFGDRWLRVACASPLERPASERPASERPAPIPDPIFSGSGFDGPFDEPTDGQFSSSGDSPPLETVELSIKRASPTQENAPADRREAETKLSEHLRKEFAAQGRAVTQAEADAQAKLMLDSVVW